MAFVEHKTLRISMAWSRNGMNWSQAFSHSRMIAAYRVPRFSCQFAERGPGGLSVDGGAGGLDVTLEGVPVALGGRVEGVAEQVDDTRFARSPAARGCRRLR